jgi:hypothetical protein
MMWTPARRAAVACLLALAAVAVLETAPLPWLWIGLGTLALLALAAVRARSPGWRLLFVFAGAVVLAPTLAEAWLGTRSYEHTEGYERHEYFRPDDVLGYAPGPDRKVHSRRVVGGAVAYDVVYSIDGRGLRVEPPVAPGHGDRCVLFFGGSYTFGEGLEDPETLPYRAGVRAKGRLRMINFGFHGYGPHQMLAALEEGVVEKALDGCQPILAVYQGIWFHAFRSAGHESWGAHGPRYVLGAQGEVIRRGHLDDDPWLRVRRAVLERLRRSCLFVAVSQPRRHPSEAEKALYVAIVERARTVFETRWPGARFEVLFWDVPWRPVEGSLEARGLRVHRVSRILPAWYEHRDRYTIPRDGHPNALADDRLAAYVVGEMLDMDRDGAAPARGETSPLGPGGP